MSKLNFHIGPAARNCLRKTSPYATLLLDVSNQLSEEDVSQFKLVIQADDLGTKRQVGNLKNGADVIRFLDHNGHISKHCTHFLRHLLMKIGRKDLVKLMDKSGEKRKAAYTHGPGDITVKKDATQTLAYTKLKDYSGSSQQTAVKEVYFDYRSSPDGSSLCTKAVTQDQVVSSFTSSPMVVDLSQSTCSQDSLKSSISDEDKIEILSEKVWKLNTDEPSNDVVMSSQ